MGQCAYCGFEGKLTREEIFSKFIARSHPQYGTFQDMTRGGFVTRSAPTVRDVCQRCNNGPLSSLDAYGAKLYARYFAHGVDPPIDVPFEYDYDRLRRWLLKLSYNDSRGARGHQATAEAHGRLIPYILGTVKNPAIATDTFVGVIASVEATPHERELGLPARWHPQVNRYINVRPTHPAASQVVLQRLVSFNSYVFLLLGWKPDAPTLVRQRTKKGIIRENGLLELRRQRQRLQIQSACGDARTWVLNVGIGRARSERLKDWRKRHYGVSTP